MRTPAVTGDQNATAVPDGAGGVIIVYNAGGSRIYAQRLDASGNRLWGADGVAVTTSAQVSFNVVAVADNAGGVLIAWSDWRNSASTGLDLYAQRLNAAGVAQWAANGAALTTAIGDQNNARIAAEANGAMLAVWEDGRNNAVTGTDVYAQRLTAAGAPQWTVGGVPVCTATAAQTHPVLAYIPGTSSVIVFVAWQDARSDGGDIYTQVLLTSGAATQAANGVLAHNVSTNTQSSPEMIGDGGQSALLVWLDDRAAVGAADLYAQKLNTAAARLFTISGVAVCTATGACATPALTSDGQGGLIAAWSDTRTGFNDVYVRRVDAQGTVRWTADGVAACTAPGNQTDPVLIADGLGGCYAAWRDRRSGFSDLYGQRFNTSGSSLWTNDGVAICSAPYDQLDPALATGGANDLFVVWDDYRTAVTNTQLYAQRLDEWGMLGAEPFLRPVTDVPNDQGGLVKLSWDASPLDTDPAFRTITEYLVYRSVPPSALAANDEAVLTLAGAATAALRPGTRVVQRFSANEYWWELLTSVPATHLSRYSVLAETSADSVAGSNPRTGFLVMARTSGGAQWWASNPDSGYSVDNLAPAAPAPLTGQYAAGETRLHWDPNREADLAGYRLYRGGSPSFAADLAHFVQALADTGCVDAAGAPYFYKLTAVDSHGNESAIATLAPAGTTAVDGGAVRELAFAAPSPNPARTTVGTRLAFSLPRAAHVRLVVLDAAGRQVRELVTGAREAGEWSVAFDGRDAQGTALAPGLYFARLATAGGSLTRRIVFTE